jgi:TfoX/Sxy family transcriptional regulator of competence genes
VPYDEALAGRVRTLLAAEDEVVEMRMMGGLAFLVAGNMAVTVSGRGGLMVRVDPAETAALVGMPHASRMVMRGRELDGWIRVDGAGVETDAELRSWVDRGVAYAHTLPPKG